MQKGLYKDPANMKALQDFAKNISPVKGLVGENVLN